MPSLNVDPELYGAASAWIGRDVAAALAPPYFDLMTGLEGSDAMAGSDSGGRAWAARYDPAARQALSAIASLQHASLTLAELLERTGFNHGRAETMSNTGRRVVVTTDVRRYATEPRLPCAPCLVPSATGGTGDTPTGWSLVDDLVGLVWPDGSPDRLRAAASAWRAAGRTIEPLSGPVDSAVAAIEMQRSPEVADVVTVCAGLRTRLTDTAAACEDVAAECDAHAARLDELHDAVKELLVELLAASAVTQVAGLFGAVFTLGASEGLAQSAEGSEIAACAARIAALIAQFCTRALEAVPSLLRAEHAAKDVEVALTPLREARLVPAELAEVESAEVAATATERTELAAEQRLRVGAGMTTDGYAPAARSELSSSQLRNLQRFEKRLPAGAGQTHIASSADGTVSFSAEVAGRVPGSSAVYTKVVDGDGATVTFYKTTFGPDGRVIHVKVKYP